MDTKIYGWNSASILGKPLLGFRMDFFSMFYKWNVVPRRHTKVWLTGKVTKEAFPSPPHFVRDPQGFIHTPIYVVLLPPRGVLRFEVRGRGILFLLPLLVGG